MANSSVQMSPWVRHECEQLAKIASIYHKHGKLRLAENSYKLIIQMRETNGDLDSLDLAVIYYNLAKVYSDLGSYKKIRPLYTKAAFIFEKHSRDDHLSSLCYADALVKLHSFSEENGLDWEERQCREA